MYVTDGGYSSAQFNADKLRKVVATLSKAIPYYLQQTNADGIAVTGKSGLSMAFATLSHIDFPLVVVRKEGEKSHGSKIEGREGIQYKRLLVLDDFVSSGNTIHMMQRSLNDRCEGSVSPAKIVGVLEWAGRYGGSFGWLGMSDGSYVDCLNVCDFDESDPTAIRFKEPRQMRKPSPLTPEEMVAPYGAQFQNLPKVRKSAPSYFASKETYALR